MITIDQSVRTDIERTQEGLTSLREALAASGAGSMWQLALFQLNRFIADNIEVDEGRTKNSIFTQIEGEGNNVTALLGTNVSYSPFMRDAGHSKQFFEYAAEREAPGIGQLLGAEVEIRVQRAFS